jgi:hypothetical protein
VKVMPCKPGRAAVMERQVAATAEVQRGNPQRDFDDFLSCSEASIRSAADGKASRLLAPPMVNCSSSRTAQLPQRR